MIYWDDVLELFKLFGLVFLIVFCVFGLIIALFTPISYISCMDRLDSMQVEGVWRFWTGCYVNQGGMLIPFDKWIVVIQP